MDTQTKTPKNDPGDEQPIAPDESAGGSSQSTLGDVAEPPASPEPETETDGDTPQADAEKPKNKPRPYVVFEKTGDDTFKLLRTGVLALRPEVAIESCIAADATGSYAAVTERSWHVLSTETETVTKRKWA